MTREEAMAILEVSKHMATSGRLYNQAIDMAIESLSEPNRKPDYSYEAEMVRRLKAYKQSGDLISRADAIGAVQDHFNDNGFRGYNDGQKMMDRIKALPSAEAVQGWIPIKWHEITEEEREREGYPKDWVVYIDCEMPCDEQEILVQTKNGYIRWDVCYEDGGFSLDSGWDWIEDIIAWMPLPKPYKVESEE